MNDEDFNALKIRFDEKWTPGPFSGCWIWTMGGGHVYGYGQFDIRGKKHSAHRISWMLYHGVIPNGMSVLHRCDTTACVNPDHLFLGTQADNISKGNRP